MFAARSFTELFFEQAARRPEQNAFYYCRTRDHKWVNLSWKRYRDEVATLAQWLQQQGIQKGDKVGIIAANRPEWIIVDLAILSAGAVSVPIYATSTAADTNYILEHSSCALIFVDQLERVPYLSKSELPQIVCFDKSPKKVLETFKSRIVAFSTIVHDARHSFVRPVEVSPDDLATIIYTSGTTGKPKGVLHTHGNLMAAVEGIHDILQPPEGTIDRYFSFLPLSHVAERTLVEVGSIIHGAEVAFARSIDTLGEDLARCRPTILLCVPRLWEKIYEKITAGIIVANPVKRSIFGLAQRLGQSRLVKNHIKGKSQGLGLLVSDALVGKKLKERLGMDRCRMFLTGSAPTRSEVMRFFGTFGIMLREVYGLTENLCLGVLNDADEAVIGSCGRPFPGNEMRIADDGEIMFRAPYMFKGYYKNPEATAEVLGADGWFATGDLGKIDGDGRLSIVGRKKELLKTSGGKYIAPVPIEDDLKALSLIKEALVVGDARKYCVALVSLDDEQMTRSKHTDDIKEELKVHLKKLNEHRASYETIKRLGIIKETFSVENGSLTPSMKVKRTFVCERNGEFIERLYRSDEQIVFE